MAKIILRRRNVRARLLYANDFCCVLTMLFIFISGGLNGNECNFNAESAHVYGGIVVAALIFLIANFIIICLFDVAIYRK